MRASLTDELLGPPAPLGRTSRARELRQALLDLAQGASSYLRYHPDRAVRVAAALLVAASLTACDAEEAPEEEVVLQESSAAEVAPLAGEIRTGLPTRPGRYALERESLVRDAQGAYHFAWMEPGAPSGARQFASSSLMKLAPSDRDELEVPAQGDPILHLKGDTPIPLVAATSQLVGPTPTPGPSGSTSRTYYRSYWYPFSGGVTSGPSYYDPPRTIPASGRVDGGVSSPAPRPPAERTVGLPHAVSGRAGGTGTGTAASFKSGAGVSSPVGAGVSSVKSSGFSGGKSSVSSGSSS
jgi:hypothetical protein